jgi:hypothetical protein
MESRFNLFGDCVSIGAWLAHNAPLAMKLLWKHPMIIVGEEAQVEGRLDLFGDSANLDAR